jgi:hypothetical protein
MRYPMPALLLAALLAGACQPQAQQAGADYEKLQAAILQKQDLLLQIHLDLDSAASDISDAEQMAHGGNCSGAEYHSAEAYRKLRKADAAILDLGSQLQALFNLDSSRTGG